MAQTKIDTAKIFKSVPEWVQFVASDHGVVTFFSAKPVMDANGRWTHDSSKKAYGRTDIHVVCHSWDPLYSLYDVDVLIDMKTMKVKKVAKPIDYSDLVKRLALYRQNRKWTAIARQNQVLSQAFKVGFNKMELS